MTDHGDATRDEVPPASTNPRIRAQQPPHTDPRRWGRSHNRIALLRVSRGHPETAIGVLLAGRRSRGPDGHSAFGCAAAHRWNGWRWPLLAWVHRKSSTHPASDRCPPRHQIAVSVHRSRPGWEVSRLRILVVHNARRRTEETRKRSQYEHLEPTQLLALQHGESTCQDRWRRGRISSRPRRE